MSLKHFHRCLPNNCDDDDDDDAGGGGNLGMEGRQRPVFKPHLRQRGRSGAKNLVMII